MIGLFYTFTVMMLIQLFHLKYYLGFIILSFGILLYRNSIGLQSKIFGYFFLFSKRKKLAELLNFISSTFFVLFYFNKELVSMNLEKGISIIVFDIVLYYWLFEGLPMTFSKNL